MEENKTYYTLRYCRTDESHKAGEKIAAASETVRIGQQEDCDLRFANDSDFADETFAIVSPRKDKKGWKLIACSENVRTTVNGTPVEIIHYLSDGDHISFDGYRQELLFNLHSDADYSPSSGIVHVSAPMPKKTVAALVMIPLLFLGAWIAYSVHTGNQDKARAKTLDRAKASVYMLTVNTVCLERIAFGDTARIDSFQYEAGGIVGTAFLTADSLIVTARHCIEPWLNDGEIMEANAPSQLHAKPTRWALLAETYNQTHGGDTIYRVVSEFSLYSGDKGETLVGRYRSDQFAYDDSRDDIIEKGDFAHEYYWRSLRRRHARKDMMLGDVATMKTGNASEILLADSSDMARLVTARQRLDFIGFPSYGKDEQDMMENAHGEVRHWSEAGDEMIAHNGMLVPGYSGGPALVVEGSAVYAVGVVSVTAKVGDRMFSVPATAIKKGAKQ